MRVASQLNGIFVRRSGIVAAMLVCLSISACAPKDPAIEIHDPYENKNRNTHAFNVKVDRAVVRPVAKAYGEAVPDKTASAVNNFAFNFSEPRNVVNALLQLRLEAAADATVRFLINSTIGLAGLMDPASKLGIEGQSTDFGETLYVWGVNEGPYVELPFMGPSTARHTVGRVADLFMNPLSYVIPAPESYLGTASSLGWALDTRDEFSLTVDDIYDNSADSYAQARILYLQNRRFKLGGVREEDVTDPFEELGLE